MRARRIHAALAALLLAAPAWAQTGPGEQLGIYFQVPAPPSWTARVHPKITAHADIRWIVEGLTAISAADYYAMPGNTTVLGVEPHPSGIIQRLDFDVATVDDVAELESWAYVYHRQPAGDVDCAVLTIPGSGNHVARDVMFGRGYHGDITAQVRRYCHQYIPIRESQDARAREYIWPVNGQRQVLTKDVLNGLAVAAGFPYAYEVRMAAELVAWAMYLDETYGAYSIIGLSQGATFAAVTAAKMLPCATVLASGFSLEEVPLIGAFGMNAGFNLSGINAMVPDIIEALDDPSVLVTLNTQQSQRNAPDTFSYDGTVGGTADALPNADVIVHGDGHRFLQPETANAIAMCQ